MDLPEVRGAASRGLYMLLMALAYQLSGTVICCVTVIQFVVALLSGTPNVNLIVFGRSLGTYLKQIVDFLTFASEVVPFPFSPWPCGDTEQ